MTFFVIASHQEAINVNNQKEASANVVVCFSRAYRDGVPRGGASSILAASTPTFVSPRHEPLKTITKPRNLQFYSPSSL